VLGRFSRRMRETLIISVLHPSHPPDPQPRTKDDDEEEYDEEEYDEEDDDNDDDNENETLARYKPWAKLSCPVGFWAYDRR
ncbi:MAG TPA: hypothetical protein VK775_01670, partial [Chthoniobacterales bacterium]|nr:hypothetical protein [Chthoniobacterales bacterium]